MADDSSHLASAEITVEDAEGNRITVGQNSLSGSAASFVFGDTLSVGVYGVYGVSYVLEESDEAYSVDLSGHGYGFEIVEASVGASAQDSFAVYYENTAGEIVESNSIEAALDESVEQVGQTVGGACLSFF